MKKLKLTTYFGLLLVSVACAKSSGGTSTGNPVTVDLKVSSSSQIQTVAMKAKSLIEEIFFPRALALPPPSLVEATGLAVTLDSAWMSIKEIEFKSTEAADGTEGLDIKLRGPFTIDLLAFPAASIGSAQIPQSGIRRFRATWEKVSASLLPSAAPAALVDQAILLVFRVNGHKVTVRSDQGISYEVGGPNALTPAQNGTLLVSILTSRLFKRINLSGISTDVTIDAATPFAVTNPCPLIDSSANTIYDCFKGGLRTQANFGEDNGNDGELNGSDNTVR